MAKHYVVRPIQPTPDQEYRHGYEAIEASKLQAIDFDGEKYEIMGEFDTQEKAESMADLCKANACHLIGKDDYADAVDSQTACNLGALAHSFERVITKFQYEARLFGRGTDWINEHPIVRLYAEQFSHLSSRCAWQGAHDYCTRRK
jgi:hypothetical protein